MSFLSKFDLEFRGFLAHRADGFRKIFELLEAKSQPSYTILETGMLRLVDHWHGDGQSTRLFDSFVNYHCGHVFSVDIDPAAVAAARSIVSPKTHCICSDSVLFLHDLSKMMHGGCNFDLVYLDSFDLDLDNPDPSSFHHIKELMAIGPLKPGTIVAVDDNFQVGGKNIGKGRMIEEYFANISVPLIYNEYQKVWQIPLEPRFLSALPHGSD